MWEPRYDLNDLYTVSIARSFLGLGPHSPPLALSYHITSSLVNFENTVRLE